MMPGALSAIESAMAMRGLPKMDFTVHPGMETAVMAYMRRSRMAKLSRWKSDSDKGGNGMDHTKKMLEITGSLIYPITVGESAFIHEGEGIRRTSTVLSMEKMSQSEIRFETRNTRYLLHMSSGMEASAV